MARYNLQNLYSAKILSRHLLNKEGSLKNTYQIVIDIEGSHMEFIPGDCLGVMPENDPKIVSLCVQHMKAKPSDKIIPPIKHSSNKNGHKNNEKRSCEAFSLKEYLTRKVNITRVKPSLLKVLLKYATSEEKKNMLTKLLENKEEQKSYLESHELWDTLQEFYSEKIPPQEICETLLPLLPRLYSISSAQCVYPDEIHLTVSYVEYETSNIKRHGVASHYLCKLARDDVKIYIHHAHKFKLPENPSTSIIMIGVGSGIAPFISFIQNRYFYKSPGKNWLFFGERNKALDFYYERFLEKLEKEKFLKVTTAFSRDQEEKIYVQHRLLENKSKIWQWIQKGASIYVCGDAKKMAADVDNALVTIFIKEGAMDERQAKNFLEQLLSDKRYLKDVY